jgi:hypothetical protein
MQYYMLSFTTQIQTPCYPNKAIQNYYRNRRTNKQLFEGWDLGHSASYREQHANPFNCIDYNTKKLRQFSDIPHVHIWFYFKKELIIVIILEHYLGNIVTHNCTASREDKDE